eukprot:TRINITY_DN1374_c0_g1_i5.p2 TRINITY_DN1374_c0_g1~~TRINITY_DN1374_c0_g1_i5.p2  ORF type:complete len:262 (+),score=69.44 TRINITY_DN1374_c0_g1_i5:92-877(+)
MSHRDDRYDDRRRRRSDSPPRRRSYSRDRGRRGRSGSRGRRDRYEPPNLSARFCGGGGRDCKVLMEGLPPTTDWKDLKDWLRNEGKSTVKFAAMRQGASGIAEFVHRRDAETAVRLLDGVPFTKNGRTVRDKDGTDYPIRMTLQDYDWGQTRQTGRYREDRSRSPAEVAREQLRERLPSGDSPKRIRDRSRDRRDGRDSRDAARRMDSRERDDRRDTRRRADSRDAARRMDSRDAPRRRDSRDRVRSPAGRRGDSRDRGRR